MLAVGTNGTHGVTKPRYPGATDHRSNVPAWLRRPGGQSGPALRLNRLAILALVAVSACGRSRLGGAADAGTSTPDSATADAVTETASPTDTGSGTASNRADGGVNPDSSMRDTGIPGDGGGVRDGRATDEGEIAGTGTRAFTQISAGGDHTCGLRADGSVTCWGGDFFGQSAPAAGTYTQISAGGIHTCGLRASGSVTCWGDNSAGQSTYPQAPSPRSPPAVPTPAGCSLTAA